MEKLRKNKFLVIGIAAVVLVAVIAVAVIIIKGNSDNGNNENAGSGSYSEMYSATLPEYEITQQYETTSLSDGSKRVTFDSLSGSIIQYADTSGISSLLTSTVNCVTVCTFDYSQYEEALEKDFLDTYIESKSFNVLNRYCRNSDGLRVQMAMGTIKSFTESDTSVLLLATTEDDAILIVITGISDCTYTDEDNAQIYEAAYQVFNSINIIDIPTM